MEKCRVPLMLIAGAPGAGKSTVVPRLAQASSGFVAVDMDELLDNGSILGIKMASDEAVDRWPGYNRLWMVNLGLILRSGIPVVFSSPLTPHEVDTAVPSGFAHPHSWILLDCSDDERVRRLQQRGWAPDRIRYAVDDARDLRDVIPSVIDTDRLSPGQVSELLQQWAETVIAGFRSHGSIPRP